MGMAKSKASAGGSGKGRRTSAPRTTPTLKKKGAHRVATEPLSGTVAPGVTTREGTFRVVKEEVRADDRGRVPIGQDIAADQQYRVLANESGQILLDPVVTVPTRELWLFRNENALLSLIRGVHQAQKGDLHDLGSFAPHADGGETDEQDDDGVSGSRGRVVASR